jgi:uncharacterized sodium:solute symporter family permease YidK
VRIIVIAFLIVLGVLGIASWLKSRRSDLNGPIGQLEAFEGWIGIAGLVWGIILLLRWLAASSVVGLSPGAWLIALVVALVITALSLLLAMSQLRALFGANDFTNSLARVADRVGPFKIALGFACLILALYQLLGMLGLL